MTTNNATRGREKKKMDMDMGKPNGSLHIIHVAMDHFHVCDRLLISEVW